MNMQPSSLTISDLYDMLEQEIKKGNGNLEVKFAYKYGDFWRTVVAANIDNGAVCEVQYSEYHQMDKVFDVEKHTQDEIEELREKDELKSCFILNVEDFI